MIGEDADFEKSGRILNRVIECDRHYNEADQRHVRETFEDLELERANHSATPCALERKSEGNTKGDESEEENRHEQGQTRTTHEWDGISDGDDTDRSADRW